MNSNTLYNQLVQTNENHQYLWKLVKLLSILFFKSALDEKQTPNCCQAPIQAFLCENTAFPNIAPATNWHEKYCTKFLPMQRLR